MSEKKEMVVALEMANAEFDRFVDAMDLELDEAYMDEEDLNSFRRQKNRILKAIQNGSLVISEAGEAVYTPRNKSTKRQEPITFHERTGASLMAMDGKKKNSDVAKTYAIMGDMCKVHPSVFAGMAGTDIKVCEALFALLMD